MIGIEWVLINIELAISNRISSGSELDCHCLGTNWPQIGNGLALVRHLVDTGLTTDLHLIGNRLVGLTSHWGQIGDELTPD